MSTPNVNLVGKPTLLARSRSVIFQHPDDPLNPIISHVGEFGRYQKILFITMIPFAATYCFVYMAQIFVIVTPEHYWCKVPQLAKIGSQQLREKLALPYKDGKPAHCYTWDTDWDDVVANLQPPPPGTPIIKCSHGFEFELSEIPYETIVTERQWVCDRAYYVPVSQCFFFVGSVVGGLITGWMADRFGRVPAVVASNLTAFIGGVMCIYTSAFWDFTFWRFIGGTGYDNCFIMVYILVLEYVGSSWRTFVANMSFSLFFGGFSTILPAIAYITCNWRIFMWVTSLPMLVAFITPWIIPESVSWLASRGKTDRAVKILKKFALVNKRPIPDSLMEEFVEQSSSFHGTPEDLFTVCHSPMLGCCLILMILTYAAATMVYDALMRQSENMGFNFFITFALNCAMEVPANALIVVLLDRLGRRMFTFLTLAGAVVLSFIAAIVPRGLPTVLFAVSTRFLSICAQDTVCQWAPEVLPTPMRASGSSLVHISGYVASVFSPVIIFVDRVWGPLPYLILSFISFLGAAMSLFLPETTGLNLPQSVEEANNLVKEHRLKFKRPAAMENRPTSANERTMSISDNPSNFVLGGISSDQRKDKSVKFEAPKPGNENHTDR